MLCGRMHTKNEMMIFVLIHKLSARSLACFAVACTQKWNEDFGSDSQIFAAENDSLPEAGKYHLPEAGKIFAGCFNFCAGCRQFFCRKPAESIAKTTKQGVKR